MLIWRTLFWPLCVVIFYLQVSSPNSPTSNDRKKIQKKWLAGAKLWSGNDSPCPWWMQVQQQHTHCYVRHYHASRKKMVLPGRGVWNLFSAAQPQITCCCSHSSNCSRFLLPSARRRRIVFLFSFRIVFHSWKMSLMEWNNCHSKLALCFVCLPINEGVGKSCFNFDYLNNDYLDNDYNRRFV